MKCNQEKPVFSGKWHQAGRPSLDSRCIKGIAYRAILTPDFNRPDAAKPIGRIK
jgi:hypothetical protein